MDYFPQVQPLQQRGSSFTSHLFGSARPKRSSLEDHFNTPSTAVCGDKGLTNQIKANSGVRSWRFYRSSTRLPVSGRVKRVTLWGDFSLSAVWCPRLERCFWLMEDCKIIFRERYKRSVTPNELRAIVVSLRLGCFEGAGRVRRLAMRAVRINGCQGTPWSEELNGKKLYRAAWRRLRFEDDRIHVFFCTTAAGDNTSIPQASTNMFLCCF